MKLKQIFVTTLILFMLAGHLNAQVLASFSFSKTPVSVSGWTNIAGNPSRQVLTATAGGLTLTSVNTANWAPRDTTSSANNFGDWPGVFFPPDVMSNDWFVDNGANHNLALYNAVLPQLQISGLNKDSTYTLRMSGNNVFFGSSVTRYTVMGSVVYNSQDLDTYRNTTHGVTFQHVSPDASGVLKIFVSALATTDVAFICGLQVYSGSSNVGVPTVAITSPGNGSILPEGGSFTIRATATVTPGTIAKVEFFADTNKIGEATSAPYSMNWADPAPGSYQLSARATDNTGTINTALVNVAVESLNYFWSTTGNIATGADSSFIGTVDTNRLAFRTNNIERMSILNDGSVGIGIKNTYGYKLAVNGAAIFTKVRIKTAGTWPDYVFKKGYALPDLLQLERYISEHKHLPGILSEKEAGRDGFDMGDQQAALLRKVEELTLYLIGENHRLTEQNKKILEQNTKLEDQQRQIDELRRLLIEKKQK